MNDKKSDRLIDILHEDKNQKVDPLDEMEKTIIGLEESAQLGWLKVGASSLVALMKKSIPKWSELPEEKRAAHIKFLQDKMSRTVSELKRMLNGLGPDSPPSEVVILTILSYLGVGTSQVTSMQRKVAKIEDKDQTPYARLMQDIQGS